MSVTYHRLDKTAGSSMTSWGNYCKSYGLTKSSSFRQSWRTPCLIWPPNNAGIMMEAHTELETHNGNESTTKMTWQSQAFRNMPVTVLCLPPSLTMARNSRHGIFLLVESFSVSTWRQTLGGRRQKCIRKRTALDKILICTLHSFNFEVSGSLFRVRSSNSRFRQVVIVIIINLSIWLGKCCLVSWPPML